MMNFRTYPENKFQIEQKVLNKEGFEEVEIVYDHISGKLKYPIKAKVSSIPILIDNYRCYFSCFTKQLYNNYNSPRIRQSKNLKFSELKKVIQHLIDLNLDIQTNKISQLSISFIIQMEIDVEDFIKKNVYLHKSRYYNHNKKTSNNSGIIKEYVYTNYSIGFYGMKNKNSPNMLKITLKLKKSTEIKGIITHPKDLLIKENLKNIFEIYIRRFKEIIIVDDFEKIEGKDEKTLNQYLNFRFWDNLKSKRSKQTKSNHMLRFKSLIKENNLDTNKNEIERKLNSAFKNFLEN